MLGQDFLLSLNTSLYFNVESDFMNLSREMRYRPYQVWSKSELKKIQENVSKSPWRANYHIEPDTGLLNDPNGFSFFDGKFHLFYQHFPFAAAHGLKSWVHMESDDLIHFKKTSTRLMPDTPFDSHGAYSGSAYSLGDKLFIFYTGNIRDEKWERTALQLGAFMHKNGKIEKFDRVLIEHPEDVTEHFRDPQIFNYQDQFYAIIGGQSHDKQGLIKLYKANASINSWSFISNLDFGSTGSEYMIECPNLVFIDHNPVLIYSPQGLDKTELNYQNIYPNTYKICQAFDATNASLENLSEIYNLDYGFECYATQAFNAPDGRVLAVSWIGLPDIDYPSDQYDYQGALSLVKELSIKEGRLYQYPVPSINTLRKEESIFADRSNSSNCYELELNFEQNYISELVLFADGNHKGLLITIDTKNNKVMLDRSQAGEQYALNYGTTRECLMDNKLETARIFIDKSIFEIFINHGEKVFTGRIFPDDNQSGIYVKSGKITGKYFLLEG
jgi:beta-fructofuranosidase